MKVMLEVPGWKTLEEIDVDKFPVCRPRELEIVAVWSTEGEYQGAFRARESHSPRNGIKLVSIVSGRVIDSNCDPVYWRCVDPATPKNTGGPAVEIIHPDQVKPGDKIQMFDAWWNVRYINFYAGSKRFQLQREEDEIHPLCDKTCMKLEVHDGLPVRITRMLRGGRNA